MLANHAPVSNRCNIFYGCHISGRIWGVPQRRKIKQRLLCLPTANFPPKTTPSMSILFLSFFKINSMNIPRISGPGINHKVHDILYSLWEILVFHRFSIENVVFLKWTAYTEIWKRDAFPADEPFHRNWMWNRYFFISFQVFFSNSHFGISTM